jgi:hypothetical protein
MDEYMFQTRLVVHLILKTFDRPRGMIDGRTTEDVVQDQRPTVSAFVVLPQSGREFVEVQKPRGLLIASKRFLVQFREELGIHCVHIGTSVPDVAVGRTKQRREKFQLRVDPGAVESPHKEPKYAS